MPDNSINNISTLDTYLHKCECELHEKKLDSLEVRYMDLIREGPSNLYPINPGNNFNISKDVSYYDLVTNFNFDRLTNDQNKIFGVKYYDSLRQLARDVVQPLINHYGKSNVVILNAFIAKQIQSLYNHNRDYHHGVGETVDIMIKGKTPEEVMKELLKGDIIKLFQLSEITLVRPYNHKEFMYLSISISTARLINWLVANFKPTKLPNFFIDDGGVRIPYEESKVNVKRPNPTSYVID